MRKKCNTLAASSFAIAIYVFTYFLFHYIGPEGQILAEYQKTVSKPFIVLFFGIWGVMFQFAAVMSLLIGKIFFSESKTGKPL